MSLLLLFQSSTGPAARNATLSATEGFADTAAMAVAVIAGARISAIDAVDTALLRVGPIVSGALQATDVADTASMSLAALVSARIAAVEATDTILLRVAALASATLQATDPQDTAVLRVDTGAGGPAESPLIGMMANMGTLLNRR